MLEGLQNVIGRINSIQKRIRTISNMQQAFNKKLAAATGLQEKSAKKSLQKTKLTTDGLIDQQLKKISDAQKNKLRSALPLDKQIYGDKTFDAYIKEAAKKHNLPVALIKAVIKQESQFNPKAISKAGAQGLMQLMPNTAKLLKVRSVFDPRQNIMGGAQYLKDMLVRYKGDYSLALAAYNAGPGAVDKAGKIPNFPETKNYVKKVLQYYSRYS